MEPAETRFRLLHTLLTWHLTAAVFLLAAIVPGMTVRTLRDVLVAAALTAVLGAVILPFVAALRLPFTLVLGFFLACRSMRWSCSWRRTSTPARSRSAPSDGRYWRRC